MFFRRKDVHVEPYLFEDSPMNPSYKKVLTFEIRADNSVLFNRDGVVVEYIPAVTGRSSTNLLVLAGLRKLAEDDDFKPTVIDKTGGWTDYLKFSQHGHSRRENPITNVPPHYIIQ